MNITDFFIHFSLNFSDFSFIIDKFAALFCITDFCYNLALYNIIFDFGSLMYSSLCINDFFTNLPNVLLCGIGIIGVTYIILYISSSRIIKCGINSIVGFIILFSGAGRKIIDEIRKKAGAIGTGVVGLVTGLDAALNLNDRLKGEKDKNEGSTGGGSGSGDTGSDSNSDSDKKDSNKKDTDKTENNNNDNTKNKTENNNS